VSIEAIPSISTAPGAVDSIDANTVANAGGRANPSDGSNFASTLSTSLQNLQNMDTNVDNLAVQAATGQLSDVHDYIIAATQANLATQLTVQLRNKALDAFNEIMRMQA
jgi:flagellar hook-basal body complex protein FliE